MPSSFKTFPTWYLLVQNNGKWVKYAWKSMNKICSKSTIKALEKHKRWSVVVIVNSRDVVLKIQSNTNVRAFSQFKRQKLKFSTSF